jgi:hypothetical protein
VIDVNIIELLQTIESNWPLLAVVFGLGGAWWQGAVWFKRVNTSLDYANSQHRIQHSMLCDIKNKTENLEKRIDKIEIITVQIHEELHDQEIKLAVLETAQQAKRRQSKL